MCPAREIGIDREHYAKYGTLRLQIVHFIGAPASQLHKQAAGFDVCSFRIEGRSSRRTDFGEIYCLGYFLFTKICQRIIVLVKMEQKERTHSKKTLMILCDLSFRNDDTLLSL